MQYQSMAAAERRTARFMGARREQDLVRFGVWAPGRERVDLVLYRKDGASELASQAMRPEGDGWFSATFDGAPRLLYKFRLDGQGPFPDPASRSQPFGVHGPSEVIEERYPWNDGAWTGRSLEELVIYELHVGAYTPDGTFEAVLEKLDALTSLGVTAIELM